MRKKTNSRKKKSDGDDITCKKATAMILDYLDGELDPKINRAFEAHLSICPDCVAFLNTYKKTLETVKSFYTRMPARKMKKGLTESLKRKLKDRGAI